MNRVRRVVVATLASCVLPLSAGAISTGEASDYLLIGASINDSVLISNFEIGANTAGVPQSGLSLAAPFPPPNTLQVATGVSGDGNVAVIDPNGQFNFSNLDIWADASIGVQCAGSVGACNNGDSNTTFNGLAFPANGLTGGVDFTNLSLELDTARNDINALIQTSVLDLSGSSGVISGGTTVVNLAPGLNVIDVVTGGGVDFLIENANFVVQGGANSSAIFRVPDDANMLVSQSALLVGDGGIGLGDVMFFSDKNDNNTHFSLSNAVVNGVAFWDLSNYADPSEISFNNVQGCTQAVGNKLNTGQDVRLTRCSFVPVPEPSTGLLVVTGLLAFGLRQRLGRSR